MTFKTRDLYERLFDGDTDRFRANTAFSRVHRDSKIATFVHQVVANERLDVGAFHQVEPVVAAERVRIPRLFGPQTVRQYRIDDQTVDDHHDGGRDVRLFRQHARQQLDVVHAPVQGVQIVGRFRVSGQLVKAAVRVQSQLPPVVVETLHRVLPRQAHQQLGQRFRRSIAVIMRDHRHSSAHHTFNRRAQAVRNHVAERTETSSSNVVFAHGGRVHGIRSRPFDTWRQNRVSASPQNLFIDYTSCVP